MREARTTGPGIGVLSFPLPWGRTGTRPGSQHPNSRSPHSWRAWTMSREAISTALPKSAIVSASDRLRGQRRLAEAPTTRSATPSSCSPAARTPSASSRRFVLTIPTSRATSSRLPREASRSRASWLRASRRGAPRASTATSSSTAPSACRHPYSLTTSGAGAGRQVTMTCPLSSSAAFATTHLPPLRLRVSPTFGTLALRASSHAPSG